MSTKPLSNRVVTGFTPIGGIVALVNIKLGEVIFGGVGSGLLACCCLRLVNIGKAPRLRC